MVCCRYPVEIDEKDTVLALKQKIQSELNLGDVEEQKLIHLGKILKNEQSIESANIKAGAMIVLMQSKIKKPAAAAPAAAEAGPSSTPATAAAATPATPAPAPSTAAASTPAPATASADAPMTPATPAQPPAAAAATAAATPATTTTGSTAATAGAGAGTAAASTLGMGANLEPMITDLMALGFPRDQVQAALRASFNNPDRAADYLFNGIPEHVMRDMNRPSQPQSTPPSAAATGQAAQGGAAPQTPAQQQQQQQQSPAAGAAGAGAGAGGAPGGSALAQLMANAAAQQQQPAGGDISADNPTCWFVCEFAYAARYFSALLTFQHASYISY